jgi:glycogen(starch) synthase
VRIIILTERYPPYRLGGYEVACEAVTERLRLRGHEIVVLTSSFGVPRPVCEGHVHRLLHRPVSPRLHQLGFWELRDLATLRSYRSFRPDVVYAWGVSQLFGSLWRVFREESWPVVHNVQDTHVARQVEHDRQRWALWTKPGSNALRGVVKSMIRRALMAWDPAVLRPLQFEEANLDHLIFCSNFRRDQHLQSGVPLCSHRVIYNGVDTRHFYPSKTSRPSGPLRLLFVGRLHEDKGLHVALDAIEGLLARGRKLNLDVYAIPAYPFDYGDSLRQRVQERFSGVVRFHEPLPSDQLAEVYRAHDALLFPSLAIEGLPMVLIEAMACGLPALSTTGGGSAELARDGATALTSARGDAEALAHAIERIDDDRELLARLSDGAGRLARETCDLDTVVSQTEEYLTRTIEARVSAAR